MQKVALITGYSTWLGEEITNKVTHMGYQVYTTSRATLDITNPNNCASFVKTIITKHHRLDLLINIAGTNSHSSFLDSDLSQLQKNLDINVTGAFNTMKAVVPYMRKQKSGHIINIGSLNSFLASPNFSTYCASKFALYGLSLSLAIELSTQGIQVSCIAPGALQSKSSINSMSHKSARESIPILKLILPLTHPSQVAARVEQIIAQGNSSPLILVGRDSYLIYYLQKFLPQSLWFGLQKWIWQKQNQA